MNLNHKACGVASFKAVDDAEGIAEMVVSVFGNRDMAGEVIDAGAFAASLERKLPKGVWAHDWTQPVAKTLEAVELAPGDERLPEGIHNLGGLYVRAQFNLGTQRGRDAFADLRFGTVDEFSIGYSEVAVEERGADGARHLKQLDLYEWSPVLVGANPATALLGTKSVAESAVEGATMAACCAAWDALWWEGLMPLIGSDAPLPERMAAAQQAMDDFGGVMMGLLGGLLALAPEDAEEQMTLAKALVGQPGDPAGARVASAYGEQLKTALAAVAGCVARGEAIQAMRAQDGRSLSTERRAQLAEVKAALEALLALTAPEPPPPPEPDLTAARLRHIDRKRRLRSLSLPAGA